MGLALACSFSASYGVTLICSNSLLFCLTPDSSILGRMQTIQIPCRRLAASPVTISVQSERITANSAGLWFFHSTGCDTFLENYTTEGTGGQINFTARPGTIAAVLMTGRKNALSCTEISQITGADNRTVTKLIYQERRQGAPILSDTKHGYWLAETPEEIQRCVSKLHQRAREIHGTANAIWQSMERTV